MVEESLALPASSRWTAQLHKCTCVSHASQHKLGSTSQPSRHDLSLCLGPFPPQELEEQLACVQGKLADCCAELAAAQQAATAAAAEGQAEVQRRQAVEQQLLAAQQEAER